MGKRASFLSVNPFGQRLYSAIIASGTIVLQKAQCRSNRDDLIIAELTELSHKTAQFLNKIYHGLLLQLGNNFIRHLNEQMMRLVFQRDDLYFVAALGVALNKEHRKQSWILTKFLEIPGTAK